MWGDVVTTAFVTEEGAFLRGQIRMEERVELDLEPAPESTPAEAAQAESLAATAVAIPEVTPVPKWQNPLRRLPQSSKRKRALRNCPVPLPPSPGEASFGRDASPARGNLFP